MRKEIFIDCKTGEIRVVEVEHDESQLSTFKEYRLAELLNVYKENIIKGFISTATGIDISYGYSVQDQLNYSKLANMLALNPDRNYTIVGSESHGVIEMTREQFIKFAQDIDSYETSMYLKRKELESRIESASTIDELSSIIISF